MLDEVFSALEHERVIPPPRAHPFIRLGRDFFGGDVHGGPNFNAFCETLTEIYPEWFESRANEFPRWYPGSMALSLVEAVVPAIARSGDSYSGSSETAEAMILLLTEYLDQPVAEVACVQLVGHLLTEGHEDLVLAGITVRSTAQFHEASALLTVFPDAPAAFNRSRPDHFARPESWVIARAEGRNPFEVLEPARLKINRFLLAVRLLFAATSLPIYEIHGETSPVCRFHSVVEILDTSAHPRSVRPAVLKPSDSGPIASLLELYDQVVVSKPSELVHPMQMAILKFNGSFVTGDWFTKIVDLTTAMEAAISGIDTSDIALRVCTRSAALLAHDSDGPTAIFSDLKRLYDLRSRLVHGATIAKKDLDRWLAGLSVARENVTPGMTVDIAVDRLRDLVRRAILARLVLGQTARWPLRGNPPPLDAVLAEPIVAKEWRRAWQGELEAFGAGASAGPASPLASAIFDDYPGKDR